MRPETKALDPKRLDEVIALFQPDVERLKLARARQSAVCRNQPADYLPLCLGTNAPEREQYSDLEFDMIDEFYNPDIMLYNAAWGMIGAARSGSDAVPSVRPNLGTGFVASMFGLAPTVQPHTLPWMKEHLTRKEIENFEVPDDVSQLGQMPDAVEYFEFFREKLGPGLTFLADTQSPFDIAHLVRGDDIFLDLYDDPPFVHHLMNLATQMYVKATRLMKEVTDEPLDSGPHGCGLWLDNCGVRACEDSSTLLSPAAIDEFVIPYLRRAIEPFGGGWVHYCGDNARLFDALVDDAPEVRGINFGNPERYDVAQVMGRLLEAGKFYVGGWPREPNEDDRAYLSRILAPVRGEKRGLILEGGVSAATPDEASAAMELWHELQA